ncbi:energy-coupling factor transporter ATP-binding protein EcfA2 [Microbacterium resistens]|uniref:Energy-coupling factor transporter ATP-binding protein EcfA2 n=1 Tax=Microbacterium resistens TaxID=156977 RepID=A0ABU1SCE6_9MICO|nr:hypothetical protein [Microbacterium resistens]MDR6867261.1 energy-coupling factor transporter ATP-binding protein EcfA2 [Microbacterium resistens]
MTVVITPVDVVALGAVVRIALPDDAPEALVESIRTVWRGAIVEGRTPDRTIDLIPGDEDQVLETLSMRVTLEALDHRRGGLIMFHAAGVADERGRVAAFVGPSGRGKTTLSRALSQEYGYVSDETIGVDVDLRIHPYRKPLSVVRPALPKKQISPEDAGMKGLPSAALRLSALALLERDPGLDAVRVEHVPFLDAVPDLVPQLSYLADLERPLQELAELCDAVGGVVRLSYPDASTVAATVPALLDSSPQDRAWQPAPPAVDGGPFDTSPSRDAILVDERLALLADGRVQVLDGIAPVIWLSARAGLDLDGIVAAVVEAFGAPDGADARELVGAAADELVAAGVLTAR